jgi:hypothetical protein
MALESLMERGKLADWREFVRALDGNEQLARDALRVSEYVEDRASASLARVLTLGRFPQLAQGGCGSQVDLRSLSVTTRRTMNEKPEHEIIKELDEPLPPLTQEHRERVLKALDAIEEAQHKLFEAAELLCPVPGFVHEWGAVREAAFTAKERWKAVHAALRLIELSSPST